MKIELKHSSNKFDEVASSTHCPSGSDRLCRHNRRVQLSTEITKMYYCCAEIALYQAC